MYIISPSLPVDSFPTHIPFLKARDRVRQNTVALTICSTFSQLFSWLSEVYSTLKMPGQNTVQYCFGTFNDNFAVTVLVPLLPDSVWLSKDPKLGSPCPGRFPSV